MTAIPVGPAADVPQEPPPAPNDWFGLFAGLHQTLGHLRRSLPDPAATRRDTARKIWSVRIDPTPVPLASGFGVLDVPQMFGPTLGRHWDVHTISATGFSAGSVSGWINLPALAAGLGTLQGALRFSAQSAGFANYGKMQCHLRPFDRLVFVATGITGFVIVSLDATSVADEYWGEYLK